MDDAADFTAAFYEGSFHWQTASAGLSLSGRYSASGG
jgi:hypothetical protein